MEQNLFEIVQLDTNIKLTLLKAIIQSTIS